jgi:diguanylate cyclase (GGDEF)-like protein/PAS domain S-box-containing protein
MNRFRRIVHGLSIGSKLMATLIVVEFAALGLMVWQDYRTDVQRSEGEFQSRLAQERPIFNAALAPLVAQSRPDELERTLRALSATANLRYLVVKDPRGRVIAAAGRDPAAAMPAVDIDFDGAASDGIFHTFAPLTQDGHGVGTLLMGYPIEQRLGAVHAQLSSRVFTVGAVFLAAMLAFLFFVWLITQRLENLREAAARIAQGEQGVRLVDENPDEIGSLARAFNHMAAVVQARVEEIEKSRQKFHNIADYTYDVECWFSPRGELLWVNSSVERLTGYSAQECLDGKSFPWFIVHPEDQGRVRDETRRALRDHTTGSNFEFRIIRRDGKVEWLANSWQPIYGPSPGGPGAPEFLGLRSSLNSIQALKDTEFNLRKTLSRLEEANTLQDQTSQNLRAERSRLLALLSAMNFGVVFVDRDQRIIYSNPAFAEVWSIPKREVELGQSLFEALSRADDVVRDLEVFSARLADIVSDQRASSNTELSLLSGRVLRLQVFPVLDDAGTCMGSVLIHEDITQAREAQGQLAFLAERDPLTGLFNRRRFERELIERLEDAARAKQRVALLFFDLDEFKSVNDLFGHNMGDTVLMQVASEIRAHLRKNEFFARIGGDEFALLVSDVTQEHLRTLCERLMKVVGGLSFSLGEVRLSLTSSLGVAVYPEHAGNPQELIAHADAAMYQAKDAGKNTWRVYLPDHTATLRQRSLVTWNDRIRQALRHDAFEVHLQGVYDIQSPGIRYQEALLRMPDEVTGKLLSPQAFISFAEKSNLIIDIDKWMVSRVIGLLARDPAMGALSVNISGRSFDEPDMGAYIARSLHEHGVAAHRLYVEITETAAIRDMRDAKRFIENLHATGCKVCLDDFGTGFSTFAYIKQLPVDVLKIDGMFIRGLASERDNQVFVKAMLDIARGFGKLVVAESVEDEQSLDILRSYGVDMAQGYVFDRPHAVGTLGTPAKSRKRGSSPHQEARSMDTDERG